MKMVNCQQCGTPFKFIKGRREKYCKRACYREASRQFDTVPYPSIWHNGKKMKLHRFLYEQANPHEPPLEPHEIVHHIDENPFNRAPENLERISTEEARAEHLRKHNYYRGKPRRKTDYVDPEYGF